MLNQQNFDTDTVIDIVLPAASALSADGLAHSLLQAAGIRDGSLTKPMGLELQSAPIGEGLAITALQVPRLKRPVSVLAKLHGPLKLKGPDQRAVDLMCVLFYPESESVQYLRRLSRLSRLLKNADLCRKIRETQDADTIRTLFQNPDGWMLAA